ncbi:MAG: response regulator transcription factor [Telluria sp.]
MHRVLLVEDDAMIARSLALGLRYEDFDVAIATTASEATQALAERPFDLVMFDVGLPDGDGIDLCRSLRQRDPDLPILILSARGDEATAVAGIESGADDYIRKPYGLLELTARMRRLLATRGRARDQVRFGPLAMDGARRSASIGSTALQLGKKEYDVLWLLAQARGGTVTREQILSRFGDASAIYDRTIDSHLSHLRRKLRDAGAALRIAAVYGIGYKLETE